MLADSLGTLSPLGEGQRKPANSAFLPGLKDFLDEACFVT